MVDVTEDDKNVLHYARANFQHTEVVAIGSESDALQAYKAPGSFDETGDDRKYIFLLYNNPDKDEISDLKLPSEGDAFDVKQFQDDNGLEDPTAGIGMVVKLGGNSGGGDDDTPSTTAAQGSSSAAPASSAPASSAPASSAAASSAPASSAAPSSTVAPEPSTTAADSATTTAVESEAPVSTTADASSTSSEEDSPSTTAVASQSSSDLAAASSVVPGNSTASTLVLSSVGPDATVSQTTTGSPAEQTTNGASGLMLGATRYTMAVSLMALVGLLAW
jgi:hypothetical protein